MTKLDDLETVVRLACLIEDRAPTEQRALLNVAASVEQERNATTTRNLRARWGEPPCLLVEEADASYNPGKDRPVRLSSALRAKLERRRAHWVEAHYEVPRPL